MNAPTPSWPPSAGTPDWPPAAPEPAAAPGAPSWPLWASDQDDQRLAGSQEHATLGLAAPCPSCGVPVRPDQRYCEACGAEVHPAVAAGPRAPSESTQRLRPSRTPTLPCLDCGGLVGGDGYCETCGAKAPLPRDHFRVQPADWVGGVCDRGIQHRRNEDAMAAWAAGRAAVLVVCDGVSSSLDSDVAALAAAERARDLLVDHLTGRAVGHEDPAPGLAPAARPARPGLPSGAAEPMTATDAEALSALCAATAAANQAVSEHTAADSPSPASCTFVAAVVQDSRLHWANVGDSRLYFVGDDGAASQLSTDHSVAEEQIRAGVPRTVAEAGPQAHAITRWLGRDAGDVHPDTGTFTATSPGWLVACSDGLWNYASAPAALAAQLQAASDAALTPVELAFRLVQWANGQGGKDNITVLLARLDANLNDVSAAPAGTPPSTVGARGSDSGQTRENEKD